MKSTEAVRQNLIGIYNDGPHEAFQIVVPNTAYNGSIRFETRFNNGDSVVLDSPSTSVINGQWHYLAITYDLATGQTANIYFDGLEIASMDTGSFGSFDDWKYSLTLLARNVRGDINNYFHGQVDDLKIFNYALTPEEIAQMYYDVTGEQCCIYGNPSFDVSGPAGDPDCKVDFYDFAEFANEWLDSGLFPSE